MENLIQKVRNWYSNRLEGKTKEELVRLGAKETGNMDYMYIKSSDNYQFFKLEEKEMLYYPVNHNKSLGRIEEKQNSRIL